jgi:putative transposase
MKWFQGVCSIRFNCRHKLRGHLFQGRYKAVLVDPEERGYFATVSDYIHLNPVRAGMVGPEERLVDYRWSSYPFYVRDVRLRPSWLAVERVLGELDLSDRAVGRRAYAEHMRRRSLEERKESKERAAELKALRRGWCLGGKDFRLRVLALMDGANDRLYRKRKIDSAPRREHTEAEAERLCARALAALGLQEEDLRHMKKNDERKVLIGTAVRQRTMVSNAWIAERLTMGDPSRVSRYCAAAAKRNDRTFQRKLRRLEKMSISTD